MAEDNNIWIGEVVPQKPTSFAKLMYSEKEHKDILVWETKYPDGEVSYRLCNKEHHLESKENFYFGNTFIEVWPLVTQRNKAMEVAERASVTVSKKQARHVRKVKALEKAVLAQLKQEKGEHLEWETASETAVNRLVDAPV